MFAKWERMLFVYLWPPDDKIEIYPLTVVEMLWYSVSMHFVPSNIPTCIVVPCCMTPHTYALQVILFTFSISHQRSEFFYNSRIIFESLFIKHFQEGITEPRDYYSSFSIQDMLKQVEYISKQVSVCIHTRVSNKLQSLELILNSTIA